jgi:hypothetical protein
MNKNVKGIITVLVVLGVGFFAYKKFLKPNNKKVVIKYLDATYGVDAKHTSFINNADKGYVDSWADAINKGVDTFQFNNQTHFTKGGTVKK